MHPPESRLSELLLVSIIQSKIILTGITSRERRIENHYHLIHNPAVRCREG
jgi:hypothetical protein